MRTRKAKPSDVVLCMALCGAITGCAKVESTELLIEVRTRDLRFAPDPEPAEIDTVELRVLRVVGSADEIVDAGVSDGGVALDAGAPDASTSCPLRPGVFVEGAYVLEEKSCSRYAIPSEARPPLTLGIVPSDGQSSVALIEIRATAFLAGSEVVTARRVVGFVPHALRRAPPLVLSAGCRAVVCSVDETCNDDRCVPLEVPPPCLLAVNVDAGPTWSSCGAAPGP